MSPSSSTSSRWFAQGARERLTLDDFQTSINARISGIEQMYQTLQEAYIPFETSKGVFPYQCRKAIRLLLALNSEICQCCQFLRETQMMPTIIMALRYQLLDKLHYLKEQVDRLISYLYDMNSSQNPASLRKYVQELFANLLPLIGDIPRHVSFLLDEARFQEKRLTCTTGGQSSINP